MIRFLHNGHHPQVFVQLFDATFPVRNWDAWRVFVMFIPLGGVAVAHVQNVLTIFDDGLKKQNTSFVGNIILC